MKLSFFALFYPDSLTLFGPVFRGIDQLERSERLRIQREKDAQAEKHLEYLLDQTEQIRRNNGAGI